MARHTAPDASPVVIVGAGLAGLIAALELSPMPVVLVSAGTLGVDAASAWAQGGIAAAVGPGDSWAAHAADTIAVGDGLVDPAVAELIARETLTAIADLAAFGVPFDHDHAGNFMLSREAGHSRARIVRVGGDGAGRAIIAALLARARATPSITLMERVEALALHMVDGEARGIVARAGRRQFPIAGRAVILATGGLGQLYSTTTNPRGASGSGLAMAAEAGALIADPEFVQFHPTALASGANPAPLATEALRGEGARLLDATGARFMPALHADGELAPRDIVARAVFRAHQAGGCFLDCRAIPGLAARFPIIAQACEAIGIDPARTPIPVAPAAHYHMGGVATDTHGRTSVPALWAVGEVASTGLHGANRLASNSLAEAAVMGRRAAHDIAGLAAVRRAPSGRLPAIATSPPPPGLARMMEANVGVERSAAGLAEARAWLSGYPLHGAALAAAFIIIGAMRRCESRGAHYRTDFPIVGPRPQRTFLTLTDVAGAMATDAARQTRVIAA